MKSDYSRQLELLCPTCASSEIVQTAATEDKYTCIGCEREFDYEELKRENEERISNTLEELKSEVLSDAKADLAKAMKGFGKK